MKGAGIVKRKHAAECRLCRRKQHLAGRWSALASQGANQTGVPAACVRRIPRCRERPKGQGFWHGFSLVILPRASTIVGCRWTRWQVLPDLAAWGDYANLAPSTARTGVAGPRDNDPRGG